MEKKSRFQDEIAQMKQAISEDLEKLPTGHARYKKFIANSTEIPIDLLTVLLKQLKHEGKVKIAITFCEYTGQPNGCGYCLI